MRKGTTENGGDRHGTDTASERSGSSKTSAVFAWVGAILVNAAFISLVTWGAATNWPVGAALCAVYAIALFLIATWLVRRNRRDASQNDPHQGNTALTSLLYLLFVGAVGVTGLLISINVWKCTYGNDWVSPYEQQSTYVTDTSQFPNDVLTWYNNGGPNGQSSRSPDSTFVYLPLSDATIFRGQNGENSEDDWHTSAWQMRSGEAPTEVADVRNPNDFVLVDTNSTSTEAVCFQCEIQNSTATSPFKNGINYSTAVACVDGATGTVTTTETSLSFGQSPYDLYYSTTDGLLWFRASPMGEAYNYNNDIVYSLNPIDISITATIRSKFQPISFVDDSDPSSNNNDEGCSDSRFRIMNIALLFLSVLPVIIASMVLYWRRKIPSMPIALYGGLFGFIITLTFSINPKFDNISGLVRWWLFVSSLLWLLASTFAHLTNRVKAATVSWSLNWAALAYFVSVFLVFQIPFGGSQYDTPGGWIGITLVGFLPLMLLSAVTGRLLLLVLGAIGLLIDVWKVTNVIVQAVDDNLRVPIQFVVLALSGLALGMLGYAISKRQHGLQRTINAFASRYLGRFRVENDDEGGDNDNHRVTNDLQLAEEGSPDNVPPHSARGRQGRRSFMSEQVAKVKGVNELSSYLSIDSVENECYAVE